MATWLCPCGGSIDALDPLDDAITYGEQDGWLTVEWTDRPTYTADPCGHVVHPVHGPTPAFTLA